MRIERATQRRLRLGLTPMIDVVFLLVVFFMLVSTFVQPSNIGLEQAPARGATKRDSKLLHVHIRASGAITVDGKPVSLTALARPVHSRLLGQRDLTARVSADQAVPLQRLVEVLDRLKLAGATDLILVNQ